MKLVRIAALVVATAGTLLFAAASLTPAAAQFGAACPRGYDGSRGYCIPNEEIEREHRVPAPRYRSGRGAACPRGYDGSLGYCVPNEEMERSGYYRGKPRYRGGRGVPCPRGYDSWRGRCVPNRN